MIPSYDEVYTIHCTIDSILISKRDFPIEIIVIDDGKGSDTSDHLRTLYQLEEEKGFLPRKASRPIRSIYGGNVEEVPFLLIDKENGGKADALNAGLTFAKYDYFLCLDADSILEEHALQNLSIAIEKDTLAVGGRVKPMLPKGLPLMERLYTLAQVYEYARSFSITRMVYEMLHAVPLISGAISLFHTDTVRKLGGYDTTTKGEDFELTLRLQKIGGKVTYTPEAIVYTQVPFDMRSIVRQRRRWHQGMEEVFKIHGNLFYCKRKIALTLHHMRLYEKYGCLVEIALLVTLKDQYLLILGFIYFLGILYTLYAAYKSTNKVYINLFTLCIFGAFFHYLNTFIKFSCYFTKNTSEWGFVNRREMK